jgi:hypothetical protein
MNERKFMSFDTMKISELKELAGSFGVDIENIKTKKEIIASLEEEGVTYESYAKFAGAETVEIKIDKKKEKEILNPKNTILVKMERDNFSYQTMGYTFTQNHPFVAMPEDVAQKVFDTDEGFRVATPREAQNFYS